MKKNITLYQIIAIVIAVVLWGYVALLNNPTIEKIYTLPVEFRGLGEKMVLLETDYQIQLRISGVEDTFDKLQTTDMHAIVDLSGLTQGDYDVKPDISLPENLTLVSATPDKLHINIQEKKTAAYPLSVEVGNPILPEGYNAMEPIASPGIVYLTGAEKYLEQVDKVFVGLNISGLSETYSQSLPVQVMDTQGNIITSYFTITPSAIDVIVPIVADLPEKSVAVSVDYTGRPANDYVLSRIIVEPSTVNIYGSLDTLNELLSVATAKIDITNATADIIETVDLVAPNGVSFGNTDSVTVIMQISHLETLRFKNVPVVVINRDYTTNIEIDGTVDVTVKGLADSLAKFDSNKLLAKVDVHSLKPGSYNLPVDVSFRLSQPSSDMSIIDWIPRELRVNIVSNIQEPDTEPVTETTVEPTADTTTVPATEPVS